MEYKIDFKSNKTAACGGGLLGGREHRGHVEMYSPPREREPQQVPPQAKGRVPRPRPLALGQGVPHPLQGTVKRRGRGWAGLVE